MNPLLRLNTMPLSLRAEPFDNPDWVFELKHDGSRSLAYIQRGTCDLVSRGQNRYKSFESLRNGISQLLRVNDAILYGEMYASMPARPSMFKELLSSGLSQ
jgi:bifunctional non-homologous end joining protein LigD